MVSIKPDVDKQKDVWMSNYACDIVMQVQNFDIFFFIPEPRFACSCSISISISISSDDSIDVTGVEADVLVRMFCLFKQKQNTFHPGPFFLFVIL